MGISLIIRQRGQATIEYLIVIPMLLLLFLGSLQFIFIYEAKQTLNYAAFVGTRAGALNNGSMAAIQGGLASGFAPLFSHGTDLPALKAARKLAKTELGNTKLTLIEILNPTQVALNGFKNSNGEIPNDNLMYRSSTDTQDNMNVQDANLLKVRVTYCVRLVVPLVNRMIYGFGISSTLPPDPSSNSPASMLKVATPTTTSGQLCVGDPDYPYRIAVSSEAVVRMQSPFKAPGGLQNSGWSGP